jgi:hypothetical protein
MPNLTPDGRRIVAEIASRNGLSVEAALALIGALQAGYGNQAQFNHPDLGGMGQWSQGGMIMIGDMFNNDLKFRIAAACNELAGFVRSQPAASFASQSQSQSGGGGVSLFVSGSGGGWWPAELGSPASAGGQNDMRYAYFPAARRLAIQQGGQVRVYDAGEHQISGFAQAQGGDQTLTFTSQFGLVRVADLPLVAPQGSEPSPVARFAFEAAEQAAAPSAFHPPSSPPSAHGAQVSGDAIFAAIERLAELHKKSILSDEEFAAKKRELLSRL